MSPQANPAIKNEKITDGPDLEAASPVNTRIPEPITEPIPKSIKSIVLSVGLKVFFPLSPSTFSSVFFLKICINKKFLLSLELPIHSNNPSLFNDFQLYYYNVIIYFVQIFLVFLIPSNI